MAENHVELNNW